MLKSKFKRAWLLAGVAMLCGALFIFSARLTYGTSPPLSGEAQQVTVGLNAEPPGTSSGLGAGSEDPVAPAFGGGVVVFTSRASNLAPGFLEGQSSNSPNIFLKILAQFPNGALELASVNKYGGYPTKVGVSSPQDLNFGSIQPAISSVLSSEGAPHSYAIAFSSDAEDLIDGYVSSDSPGLNARQVWLRIKSGNFGTNVLISGKYQSSPPGNSPLEGGNGASIQPTVAMISEAIGQPIRYRVAFRSSASNLLAKSPGNSNNLLYWRDLSIDSAGVVNLEPISLLQVPPASNDFSEPSLSADGTKLAFVATGEVIAGKGSVSNQVYIYTFSTQQVSLISRTRASQSDPASYSAANGESGHPSLTSDGSRIAFIHNPPNTSPGSTLAGLEGGLRPLLVKCNSPVTSSDLVGCFQINVDPAGTPSVGSVVSGSISASGRYATFADTGRNLLPTPETGEIASQVYLKRLEPADPNGSRPVYLASHKDNTPGDSQSGKRSIQSYLDSRPPVALLENSGELIVAYSSWADRLSVVGHPSEQEPYIFASKFTSPTPTPTSTPTSTDTPDDSDGGDNNDPTATPEPTSAAGSLPVIDLKPGSSITVPPLVSVDQPAGSKTANVTIFLPDVKIDPSIFGGVKKSDLLAMVASGARIKYEVEIRKSGSKQRINRVSSRNVVTVRKLSAGSYTVRYRVTATKGSKTIRSKTSPPASFKIT